MIAALAFLFCTYVAAAVPFGLWVPALFGDDERDIRAEGSGNIGATNVARVHGWRIAVPVLAFDLAKGLVPVMLAGWAWPGWWPVFPSVVGLVAFLAHCYPVYLGFHGGKGVATAAGVMVALAPLPTAVSVGTWLALLLVSRRSSVASLGATLALVVAMWRLDPSILPAAVLLATGVVHRHVPNIRRLVAGDEAAVLRPVRWGRRPAPSDPAVEALEQGPAGEGVAPPLWDAEEETR